MGGTPITLDFSKAQPLAPAPNATETTVPAGATSPTSTGVTLDFSKATPINPDADYTRQRTLLNMTAAMSGQPMQHPEDQAAAEAGRKAGFEAAGATFLTSLGGELLAAPKLLQVAARDPATGQFVRGLATEEGPTLLAQGVQAIKAAGDAHPLVKQALIYGLTSLGAGKIAHALGWLGQ